MWYHSFLGVPHEFSLLSRFFPESSCLATTLSKSSIARARPFSCCMMVPIALAFSVIAGVLRTHPMVRASFLAVTDLRCKSFGAMPIRCRTLPHKGWSEECSTTTEGQPAIVAAWVVPAPPWWITTAQWGKISWCGALTIRYMLGNFGSSSISSQFDWIIARHPAKRTVLINRSVISLGFGSLAIILPNVI